MIEYDENHSGSNLENPKNIKNFFKIFIINIKENKHSKIKNNRIKFKIDKFIQKISSKKRGDSIYMILIINLISRLIQ